MLNYFFFINLTIIGFTNNIKDNSLSFYPFKQIMNNNGIRNLMINNIIDSF